MRLKRLKLRGLLVLLFGWLSLAAPPPAATPGASRIALDDGWQLQSSCVTRAAGEEISVAGFPVAGWHSTSVPSTVLAALVNDKTYPDPYFGMNLRKIPGANYPIGRMFANLPMPEDSPFRCSWWYRREFRLPASYAGRTAWLHFGGINYRANIWLNGKKIAGEREIAGAYRVYEFNATPWVAAGENNVLAVEAFAPTEKDLGINWVDWNPAPPDKNMGLWGEVYWTESGPVSLRYPQAVTHFPSASLERADLTVMAELRNALNEPVEGDVEGEIGEIRFRKPIHLEPGEARSVSFTAAEFPQLRIAAPKLWWPAQLGPQNLHTLSMKVIVAGTVSDERRTRFGIREVTSELTAKGNRLFRVNGKRMLIRGAGWAPDMLLRRSRERLETEFRYVRDLHLNTLRMEGKLESEGFFDLADEFGVLTMAGWCCCDHWEKWGEWKPEDREIATESLRDQILRMRSHASLLVWLNGSDAAPPEEIERAYVQVLKQAAWPNPYLSSASSEPTTFTGDTGVEMPGPYEYVPPSYWLAHPGKFGGASGFNTETGPGAAIPPMNSLQKMLPADRLWPVDEFWMYHAGEERFANLDRFHSAMNASYGAPAALEDYERKAQAMAYDGERAMFEAYGRNKYDATGVIQWMLNNAWPSLIWHLYDYFLQPAGGYFGAKKACEPLHVQYSYDDGSVVVVNSLGRAAAKLVVTAKSYDFELHETFSRRVRVNIAADASRRVIFIPHAPADSSSNISFLQLTLADATGKILSSNFYWLSAKEVPFHVIRAASSTGTRESDDAPFSSVPDMTSLNSLPRVRLEASARIESEAEGAQVRLRLHNPSAHLAFEIRLALNNENGGEILPVLWEDNYFELMPGETRGVAVRYASAKALAGHPQLVVSGWNIEPSRFPVETAKDAPKNGAIAQP